SDPASVASKGLALDAPPITLEAEDPRCQAAVARCEVFATPTFMLDRHGDPGSLSGDWIGTHGIACESNTGVVSVDVFGLLYSTNLDERLGGAQDDCHQTWPFATGFCGVTKFRGNYFMRVQAETFGFAEVADGAERFWCTVPRKTNVSNSPWLRKFGTDRDENAVAAILGPLGEIFVLGPTEGAMNGLPNQGGNDLLLGKVRADGGSEKFWLWGTPGDDVP